MTKQPHRLRFIYKSSKSGAGCGSIIHERIPRPKVIFSQKSIVSRSFTHENSPSGTLETRVEKLCPYLTVHDSPVALLPEQHLPPALSSVFLITTLKPHVSFSGFSLWPLEHSHMHFERFTVLWVTHWAEGRSSKPLLSSSSYAENFMAPFEIIGRKGS